MARPSELEVEEALRELDEFIEAHVTPGEGFAARRAWTTLREASRLRPVLPTKEAAELLGVDPSNLEPKSVAGLPAPAYVFPRPRKGQADRVMRLWWKDEIEVCARAKRARLGQSREDGAKQ